MPDLAYTLTTPARASFAEGIIVTDESIQIYARRALREHASAVEYAAQRAKEWVAFWAKLPREMPIQHDPEWRNRFWSLQNAHDGNTWFWWTTGIVVRYAAPAAGLTAAMVM